MQATAQKELGPPAGQGLDRAQSGWLAYKPTIGPKTQAKQSEWTGRANRGQRKNTTPLYPTEMLMKLALGSCYSAATSYVSGPLKRWHHLQKGLGQNCTSHPVT